MWKVLGVETVLVKAGDVWHDRLVELSKRRKNRDRFLSILEKGEVRHLFDTQRETHVFLIEFPTDTEQDDVQFMGGFITKLQRAAKVPVIEFNDIPQKSTIILTAEAEEDDYETRRKKREAERARTAEGPAKV